MRFAKAVVKHRIPILIIALILLVPSTLGMLLLGLVLYAIAAALFFS